MRQKKESGKVRGKAAGNIERENQKSGEKIEF